MERLPIILLGFVVACGPGMGTEGRDEGESETATETGETDTESTDEGETETETETDTGTGESETGDDPSECHGGEELDLDWGSLDPAVPDNEFWEWGTTHTFVCVVTEVVDPRGDDAWTVTLSCEGDGVSLELDWSVPVAYELLDATWVGMSLSVVASGNYHPAGSSLEGWFVVRDEGGELVWISTTRSLPGPEWTDPISIEVLDLGDECTLNWDDCYPIYGNVVLFDSALDGELRAYEGGGHQTENFTYLGESTTYEQNFRPFDPGDCEPFFDYPLGRWDEVRVVRRP